MFVTAFVHRLRLRQTQRGELASATTGFESCPPPSLRCTPRWRLQLRRWLAWAVPRGWGSARATLPEPPLRGTAVLPVVQREFIDALADLESAQAGALLTRIKVARSLRELWHLRPEVYELVAIRHSQAEAELRLARLNRHFPTRAPRSGFGALDRPQTPS